MHVDDDAARKVAVAARHAAQVPEGAGPLVVGGGGGLLTELEDSFTQASQFYLCGHCGFFASAKLWKRGEAIKRQTWLCGVQWSELKGLFPKEYGALTRPQSLGGYGSENCLDGGIWTGGKNNWTEVKPSVGCQKLYKASQRIAMILEWRNAR